jgi:trimethylamine--corrinoid protein Co-methyltransferase
VQTNAEILATNAVAQLASPGTPTLYGCVNSIMDPLTGSVAWGSTETGMITVAAAQLARRYHMPSRAAGAVTNANSMDLQNGMERFGTLFAAVGAGINYLTCAGTYASLLASSLELLVIDDELAGACTRYFEGIVINDDTIALKEIETVATSETKSYITSKHTRAAARTELFIPRLSDRLSLEGWILHGMPSIVSNARAKVDEILAQPAEPTIGQDIIDRMEAKVTEIEERERGRT